MLTATASSASTAMHFTKNKIDGLIVRYDGWWLVLLAVLMVLAFVMLAALAIWCLTSGKGRFSGNWSWGKKGVSVWVECV